MEDVSWAQITFVAARIARTGGRARAGVVGWLAQGRAGLLRQHRRRGPGGGQRQHHGLCDEPVRDQLHGPGPPGAVRILKNQILRVSLEKKKDARAGFRVKTTFFRIIIRGDYYDAEKSGFHAGSRACVLFFSRDTLRI